MNISGPTALNITKTDASCGQMNGSVILGQVTGGTGPFTFSFNNSAFTLQTQYNGLVSGIFPITVKDANNCDYTTTVTILSPNAPSNILTSITNETCDQNNGGIVLGMVTGGTSPYTYSINGSPFTNTLTYNNLGNGMYTIVVKDANDCNYNTIATILAVSNPKNINITTTNTNCGTSNGSIKIDSVSGGISPFEFSINGSSFTTNTLYSSLSARSYDIIVKDATGCTFTKVINVNNIGGPTDVQITKTNATCGNANGTITIGSVTGGLQPMEYNFDNRGFSATTMFNNLPAGDFNLTVRDANDCLFSKIVTIEQIGDFIPNIATIHTTCGLTNGSLSATPIGNNYSYLWSQGSVMASLSNLGQGTYMVTITEMNSGCQKTATATVLTSQPLEIFCNPTDVSSVNGNDGQATINVTNFKSRYNVSWSGPLSGNFTNISANEVLIENLIPGTYTVNITDVDGCTDTCIFTIKNKDCAMTADATGTSTNCFGGQDGKIQLSILNATGNTTLRWSNPLWNDLINITNALAGSYTVTVTDAANCTVTENVLVGQPTEISLQCSGTFVSLPGAKDGSGSLLLAGGTPNYTVAWSGAQSGNLINQTPGNINLSNLSAGAYLVTVTDNNNCNKICNFTVGDSLCPIKAEGLESPISCPDYCDGSINVSFTNQQGATQITWNKPEYNGKYSIENLCSGTYKATITDAQNCSSEINLTLAEPQAWSLSITTDKDQVLLNESVNLKIITSLQPSEISSINWKADPQ
ncbi:MAG: hypothetical protein IPN86_04965 [Saprospiraceae bacterium]|nr:hypothetical protein [Saprospiraceae bacterium]